MTLLCFTVLHKGFTDLFIINYISDIMHVFFFFLVSNFTKQSGSQSVCCTYVFNKFVSGLFINTLLRLICYPLCVTDHLSNVTYLFHSLTGHAVDIKTNDKGQYLPG